MSVRVIPQWLIDDYPWLRDVFSALIFVQELWHQHQSLVILIGLVFVWRQLRQERIKFSERVDTLGQIVRATRDETEAALLQPSADTSSTPAGATADTQDDPLRNWEAIRSIWREARDRLELAIEGISRSRVRGKYSKLDRYSYRDVINALEKDGVIAPTVSNDLRAMDIKFNTLKFRPQSITSAQAAAFKQLFELPDARLPKLPEDEPPGTPMAPTPSQEQVQVHTPRAA